MKEWCKDYEDCGEWKASGYDTNNIRRRYAMGVDSNGVSK